MSADAVTVPKILRRNHGRGHSYAIDGEKVLGSTSILSKGYPKHLEKWAADQSTLYAVDNWDELAAMPISERIKLISGARFADRDKAANRGREVHRIAKRLALGEEVPVPEELEGHVDAYLAFASEWLPREVLLETTVASLRFRYCGTLDLVADLIDGYRWLLDLKTTRSGIFRETALQLASYRFADVYLDEHGVPQPMPKVDRCGAVWLRGDRSYELREVDASPETFRIFLCAKHIADFDARDDVIGAPIEREET